jgi:hypothetical protein
MILARLVTIWLLPAATLAGYVQDSQVDYLANFDAHIAASYAVADDSSLLDPCKQKGELILLSSTVVVSSSGPNITSEEVQNQCDSNEVCVIPAGLTLTMTNNLHVGALSIEGSLLWTDDTQSDQDEIYLRASYVVTETGGNFYMNLSSPSKQAWIYLKNNGATHSLLRTRVFGGIESSVEVTGRPLQRTWSLLDKDQPLNVGDAFLHLLHHPIQMGWRIGDRIGVAPTE